MILFLMNWSLATIGFLLLAASMQKHQKQLFNRILSPKNFLIIHSLGWAAIVLTLILCIVHYDIADGISFWVGVLSFSALYVVTLISYFQNKFKWSLWLLSILFALSLMIYIMQ